MRSVILLAFGMAGLLVVGEAGAQGRVDRRALDELSGTPTTPAPAAKERPQRQRGTAQPRQAPAPPVAAAPAASAPAPTMPDAPDPAPVLAPTSEPPASGTTGAESAVAAPTPPPLLPMAPPAPPVIPPPLAVPMRPVPPPPIVEVAADAPGEVSRTEEGWRITFGPGRVAFNPATAQAVRDIARLLPAQASVTVTAFAPGTPEDPSTSRRLSLARALAARGVLIAEGVASPRIFVRALGSNQPAIAAGPPDRVDITVVSPPGVPPSGRPAP